MSSNAIITITQMMETLPEALQNQIVEHLRESLSCKTNWEASLTYTQLTRAKQEIAEGKAEPMDLNRL